MTKNIYGHMPNAYDEPFQNTFLDSKNYKIFNLQMDDETLDKMLIKELDEDKAHWDKEPWQLTKTDTDNTKYFLGNQTDGDQYVKRPQDKYVDNRLFSS